MEEEIKYLKTERKIEKRELKQNNSNKKGLIAGLIAGSAVALALGLGLGLGLKGSSNYKIGLETNLEGVTLTGDGEFKKGSIVTIEAEPTDGYRFSHWNYNGQTITANPYIFELNEDTKGKYEAVYVEVGPIVSLSVDGNITEIETIEGKKLSEVLSSFTEINDSNSCGWFTSDKYLNSVDLDQEVTSNLTIYTKKATLDKLTFIPNADATSYMAMIKNSNIEGEIVLPNTYLNCPVTTITQNENIDIDDHANITNYIISSNVKKIERFRRIKNTIF